MQVGMLVGSLAAGVIISALGAGSQFTIICLLYLASVVFLLLIRLAAASGRTGRPQSVSRLSATWDWGRWPARSARHGPCSPSSLCWSSRDSARRSGCRRSGDWSEEIAGLLGAADAAYRV